MTADDLVIDQVSWHTRVIDNPETPDRVKRRFRALVLFLQGNGLTVRTLLQPGEDVSDDFALRKSDLTNDGFELVKAAYDRWLRALDRNVKKDPEDVRILVKTLSKLHEPKA